jgi:hypothetical protein
MVLEHDLATLSCGAVCGAIRTILNNDKML